MEWAPKYENLELFRIAGGKQHQCVACVGAISIRGKELFEYRIRSFNGEQFLDFMVRLKQHMGNRRFFV